MDALVPMASQPTAMASKNWMLRRMMLETIRNDPEYQNGNYTTQPRLLKIAAAFYGIATAGGVIFIAAADMDRFSCGEFRAPLMSAAGVRMLAQS